MKAASPASVLAGIPGWERASWQPLSGGLTNEAWLVEADGRRGVLKIDEGTRGAPFGDRLAEARIQRRAAAEGLAAPVLFASERVCLTEYAEGTVWNQGTLSRNDELRRLARTLRRVHKLPRCGRAYDALGAARHYHAAIRGADARAAAGHLDTIASIAAPEPSCCCHNDVVAENIVDAGGLKLLDWEYAADNDPLFDLAIVVAHHELSSSQALLLLDAYFDGDGAGRIDRLRELAALYRSLCWLWDKSRP